MSGIILIIEDRPDTVEMLRFTLEAKHKIMSAGEGKKGLAILKKKKIDLVLLDLMLPGMSGKDILKEMRADKKNDKTKVIILTAAKVSEKEQKEYMKIGAQGFLLKPTSVDAIRDEIKRVLG